MVARADKCRAEGAPDGDAVSGSDGPLVPHEQGAAPEVSQETIRVGLEAGRDVSTAEAGEAGADGVGSHGGCEQSPATLGAELRAARERAGLSIEAVAARTKVRPGILKAIEADAHDEHPALTYALGFVKAFARTVGLDPEAAAERYKRESQRALPTPSLVELTPLEEQRLPSRRLVVWTSVAAVGLIAGLVAAALGLFSGPLPPEPAAPAVREAAASAPPPPPPPAAAPADGPIRLVAKEDVWLRISSPEDGTRFFEGTLPSGQAIDLPPGGKLVLRTGRAGAIEVRIGDEVLPPLGGPVELLRAQPLDAATLRARTAPRAGLAEGPPPA
ncbi:helix-turn-helix domain-containing protein [Thermaurantiacus sp.]